MGSLLYFKPQVELSKYKYSFKKDAKQRMEDAKNRRIASILTPAEVKEKVLNGEMFKSNTKKLIYIYHDNKGVCPEACVHFYDEDGYLLWTYPWNGQVGRYKSFVCPFDDMAKRYDNIQITFTESGKVAIKEDTVTWHYDRSPTRENAITVFDYYGKKLPFVVSYGKNANEEIVKKCGGVFGAIFAAGDEFVDDCLIGVKKSVVDKVKDK